MDHLEIRTEANDPRWKQRCNKRMEKLKAARFPTQDASSQSGLEQEREKKIMMFELYEAVDRGNADRFVDVLERVSASKGLPLSAIFDQVTQAGDSLLHVAADLGREEIVELIAYHFPGLLTRTNIRGDTALHVAARSKNSGLIKVILSQCATEKSKYEMEDEEITRSRNVYGDTALHVAVYSEHLGVVTDLFNADRFVVHYVNKAGKSPVYLAVVTENMEILGLLLQTPFLANDPRRCIGNSPLRAAILKRNPALLRGTLERRPELVYLRDEDGGTPLHYAAYIGYVEGVRILLKTSTLTALERNTKGHLPIHLACKRGRVDVVHELLQPKWPNPRVLLNERGQNILHVAAKNGKTFVVMYLMRNRKIDRATLNEKDVNGNTPLHLAARNLFPKVLREITRDKRIDVKLVNKEGLTALDVAALALPTHRAVLSYLILKDAGVPSSSTKVAIIPRMEKDKQSQLPALWNWKDMSKTLLLMATLMITATIAASFTVPGGVYASDEPDPQNRGMAVLAGKPLFRVFTSFNLIAMGCSAIGSVILLWSKFGEREVQEAAISFAMLFLSLALLSLPVAIMAAIRLIVSNDSLLVSVITALGVILISIICFLLFLLSVPLGIPLPVFRQITRLIVWITIYLLIMYDEKPTKYSDSQRKDVGKGN